MTRHKFFGQRGDTIVEVLISILIVSVVLSGAYVTVSKSSVGVRNSQEHGEALKLAEGQVEEIRQDAAKATSSSVFGPSLPSSFCMAGTGGSVTAQSADLSNLCQQSASGYPTTAEPVYHISDSRGPCGAGLPANCALFTVTVDWASITGGGQATEQIVYRLYQ